VENKQVYRQLLYVLTIRVHLGPSGISKSRFINQFTKPPSKSVPIERAEARANIKEQQLHYYYSNMYIISSIMAKRMLLISLIFWYSYIENGKLHGYVLKINDFYYLSTVDIIIRTDDEEIGHTVA